MVACISKGSTFPLMALPNQPGDANTHNNNYTAPTADRGTVTNPTTVPNAPVTTGSAVPTAPTAR